MTLTYLYYSVVSCPPPPLIAHSVMNTTASMAGTFVKYDCHHGYWFPDKTFSKVIKCNDANDWVGDQLENCTGESSKIYKYYDLLCVLTVLLIVT